MNILRVIFHAYENNSPPQCSTNLERLPFPTPVVGTTMSVIATFSSSSERGWSRRGSTSVVLVHNEIKFGDWDWWYGSVDPEH